MTMPAGWNFRATVGFVTDVAPDIYSLDAGANAYPTTYSNGITAGWITTTTIDSRDRSAAGSPRLAGIQWSGSGADGDWRVDLPVASTYAIQMALGDPSNSQDINAELFDNTTSLGVICNGVTGAADSYFDATGALLTSASWLAGTNGRGGVLSKTFSSTILILRLYGSHVFGTLAHFYIAQSSTNLDITRTALALVGHDVGLTVPPFPPKDVRADFSQFPKNPIRNDAQGYQ